MDYQTFDGCESLKSIAISNNVQSFTCEFSNCDSLQDIYYEGDQKHWSMMANCSIPGNVIIHFADGSSLRTGIWHTGSNGWWYGYPDGAYATGWRLIDGCKWFYFDQSGWIQILWQIIGGIWYCFDPDGAMATNTTINGYKVGSDGKWIP